VRLQLMAVQTSGSVILDTIIETLNEREKNYDTPTNNFKRIADFWNTYLKNRANPDADISPEDVGWLMVLMKIAREQHVHKDDNLVDAVGYIICVEKIIEEKDGDK